MIQIYVIFDSANPHQNIEQLRAFSDQSAATRACEELNERDYPDAGADDDKWDFEPVDVEEPGRHQEDYYVVLHAPDGREVERIDVSETVPRTIGWNLGILAGRNGLGEELRELIHKDKYEELRKAKP